MENMEATNKIPQTQFLKSQKLFHGAQICLRILVVATTSAAFSVMITNKQTVSLYNTQFDARYSYSSAFKFFVLANAVACASSVLSLFYIFFVSKQFATPSKYFFLFLHDLMMMSLVLAGCAAATAVGFIGEYGNNHIGWIAICDNFGKFCHRITFSVALSYMSMLFLMVLTIITANRSRYIQV